MTVQVSYGAGSPVGEPGIERALADIAAGRPVVVVDDEDRENQGDLVFAAQKATPELMAFVVRHTSGFVCVALPGADCDRLSLSAMYRTDHDPDGTAYMVTVDAADGISTGISAADRARTVRVLADPGAGPADLRRPGHVVPLRAKEDGVLRRRGHTEAAVDLARLAGLRPAGVLAEIVSRDAGAGMACHDELEAFAADHGLQVVTIADLVAHRRRTETQVRRVAEARMPLAAGMFRAVGYASVPDGSGHVAFVCGDIDDGSDVLVRVHSECLTGDVFGSLRCDCGAALQTALERVAQEGRGVVLYIRGREGRGGGLLRELRAYQVQDRAAGVTGAGIAAPFPADDHDHDDGIGEQILHDLGVRSVRLPAGEPPASSPANLAYLPTGRDRTGDRLPDLAAATGT